MLTNLGNIASKNCIYDHYHDHRYSLLVIRPVVNCPQVLDYLAIGVHELASISERRVERLINPGIFTSDLTTFASYIICV